MVTVHKQGTRDDNTHDATIQLGVLNTCTKNNICNNNKACRTTAIQLRWGKKCLIAQEKERGVHNIMSPKEHGYHSSTAIVDVLEYTKCFAAFHVSTLYMFQHCTRFNTAHVSALHAI